VAPLQQSVERDAFRRHCTASRIRSLRGLCARFARAPVGADIGPPHVHGIGSSRQVHRWRTPS
jgi:hypothetical protein